MKRDHFDSTSHRYFSYERKCDFSWDNGSLPLTGREGGLGMPDDWLEPASGIVGSFAGGWDDLPPMAEPRADERDEDEADVDDPDDCDDADDFSPTFSSDDFLAVTLGSSCFWPPAFLPDDIF